MNNIRWVVRLYPPAWRERYETEIMAVLEQHRPTIKTYFDLAVNAVDAHVNPAAWGKRSLYLMENIQRLRRSNSRIILAFMAMLLSYIIFLSDLSDVFDGVIRQNAFTSFINNLLSGLNDFQLVAILAMLLLVSAAIAFQKGASSHRYLKYIPLALVLFPTFFAFFYFGCRFLPGEGCHVSWGNYVFLPLLLCVPVVSLVMFKSSISSKVLKISMLPLVFVTFGMLIEALQTFNWGILVWGTDPQTVALLAMQHGLRLWPGDYHIWLVIGLVLVVLFVGIAIAALIHGISGWKGDKVLPISNEITL